MKESEGPCSCQILLSTQVCGLGQFPFYFQTSVSPSVKLQHWTILIFKIPSSSKILWFLCLLLRPEPCSLRVVSFYERTYLCNILCFVHLAIKHVCLWHLGQTYKVMSILIYYPTQHASRTCQYYKLISRKRRKTLQLIEFGNIEEPHMPTNRWMWLWVHTHIEIPSIASNQLITIIHFP